MTTNQRVAALLYHNVGPHPSGTNPWLTVSPARFRAHLRTLAQHGYTGITGAQWLAHLRGESPLPPKPVMLTFDDGYRALGEHALPVLKEYGWPALLFVVTRRLGRSGDWRGDGRDAGLPLFTAEELRHWSREGVEFGAHSRSHADLRVLRGQALADEVAGSRVDLEQLLGKQVCAFAYPYGFHTPAVRDAVAEAFPLAFTTEPGLNDRTTDALRLRRTRVWPPESALDIRFRAAQGWSPLLGGALALASDLRNRLLRRPPYDIRREESARS